MTSFPRHLALSTQQLQNRRPRCNDIRAEFCPLRLRQRTFQYGRQRLRLKPVNTYPEPETEKERSPVDFPQVLLVLVALKWEIPVDCVDMGLGYQEVE